VSTTSTIYRTSNGDANKLFPEDRAVHDWYRFVLSYPPQLVREYLHRFGIGNGQTVLDPFCGTGTTLVECMKVGVPSVGIEANPVACFASRVKTNWTIDPDGLNDHAKQAALLAVQALSDEGIEDVSALNPVRAELAGLRRLPRDTEALLLGGSISPLPLHKTLTLLDAIDKICDRRFHDHELVALAKALAFSIGNLEFGPEVGVGKAKPDAPVLAPWLTGIGRIADDIRSAGKLDLTPSTVFHADARQLNQVLEPVSIDAVITSPPYPNEKDYTRTTRLESVLLGFVRSKSELQDLKRGLVRSNTRSVYRGDDDDRWVADHPEINRIADAIEQRRIELGKTSGFERMYARLTKLYFGGMARHLADLRTVLRPGAQLAYVVGDQASYLRVMIRTGQLLGDLAVRLGYELVGIDLFRTRLATATKEQLREEVVLLRWPGTRGGVN
jgi:hypothetical protein